MLLQTMDQLELEIAMELTTTWSTTEPSSWRPQAGGLRLFDLVPLLCFMPS